MTFNMDQVLPATAKIHVRLQDGVPGPAGPWYACTNVPPSLAVNCAGMAAPRVQARVEGAPGALPPFALQLIFQLSSKELQLDTQMGENGLERAASGTFQRTSTRATEVGVLGPSPAVATVRAWSLPFTLAGLVAFAVLEWRTRRALAGSERARIAAQFGALITTAHLVRPPTDRSLLSVRQFADLAAIAERNNLPVIQDALDLRQYVVLCVEATYHYRASGGAQPASAPPRQAA